MTHRFRRPLLALTLIASAALLLAPPAQAADHTIGVGAHFYRVVDSISDVSGIDQDGNSWVGSYQYIPRGLFKFQLDLEYFGSGFSGSTDSAFAPQAFILIGRKLYGGVGVGKTFADGLDGNSTDPYYMARLGWELGILGVVRLDFQGTYLFENFDAVGGLDVQSDTLTLGAVLRFKL